MAPVVLLVAGCLMAFAVNVDGLKFAGRSADDDWYPIDQDDFDDYENAIQTCVRRKSHQVENVTGGIEGYYAGFHLSEVNYENVKNKKCVMFIEGPENPDCDRTDVICDITSNKGWPRWKDLKMKNFKSILESIQLVVIEERYNPVRIIAGKEADMITGSGKEKVRVIRYQSRNADSCFVYVRNEGFPVVYGCDS